jgi:hypothetical protein
MMTDTDGYVNDVGKAKPEMITLVLMVNQVIALA